MSVQTINTDIAAEVNISARRNDTFTFKFTVANPLNPTQGLPMNGGQTTQTTYPEYQAKMLNEHRCENPNVSFVKVLNKQDEDYDGVFGVLLRPHMIKQRNVI